MDGIQIMLITAALTGLALVIASFFFQSGKKKNDAGNYIQIAENLKTLNASVEEADNAAEELHKLTGSVMQELDNKYQELLFLYNLIDEKKKELYVHYRDTGAKPEPKQKKSLKHPKHQEINKMKNDGMAVSDIAKKLGMGQGEVNLILELGNR